MSSKNVRKNFIDYFKSNNHRHVSSSSVVPHDDPTLLFNNAGMNQFKDVFLGKTKRDYTRAVTAQKCIRVGGKHNDLDNVGHTTRHLTFFEMLGNFSFGDYFKKEAIAFAWEVSTKVFEFDPDKIWVSVFEKDDEAFELWKSHISVKRIVRLGEKDNFWAMGDTGPCGPCTELLYDRGSAFHQATNPKDDPTGERFFEFWNLVFMQFNRSANGELSCLPKPCVDTGAGLERIMALKMGVNTVFQTDILKTLIKQVESISHKKYNKDDHHLAPAFHVIADHIRSLAFAIGDGAQPSNIERGYVLRKILRRAVRYARMLEIHQPFLGRLLPTLISCMGEDYPELVHAQTRIEEILYTEEENFIRTLKRGGNILQNIMEKAESSALKQISGEDAFKLKDTYGFPLEEILLIAKDANVTVNLESYELLEEGAKERSRKAQGKVSQEVNQTTFSKYVEEHGICQFTGYDLLSDDATIMAMIKNGEFVSTLTEGEEGLLLLNKTPFYAEKGGQVADHGHIRHHSAEFNVTDCMAPFTDVITHIGKVTKGTFFVGEPITAFVDEKRRKEIATYHSATHLLHFALNNVLGPHIKQAGSLVETNYLRFDFNHHKALTKEELRDIEVLINTKIKDDATVHTFELSYEEAQKMPEIKQFFGDKYGNKVRVVDMGGYSKELCGGTHLKHIATIGLFKIKKEASVAAGVRRIEAVCGLEALNLIYEGEDVLHHLCEFLGTQPVKLSDRMAQLLEEQKKLKQELDILHQQQAFATANELFQYKEKVGNISFIAKNTELDAKQLLLVGNQLMDKLHSGIVFLSTKDNDRCQLLIKVSLDLQQKGIKAGELIRQLAPIVEGSGGGKPDLAQAGGKNPKQLPLVIETFKKLVSELC
ncbi:MAG: alanine--tRNA ligase [Chlamydiales bacterium]|nr:alanine--tRNA ligase [Chlamydiales bacterium]